MAVTRWLSHSKAVQRVLDRYEAFVGALDTIYLRKMEPGVCSVMDDLVNPTTVAALCFVADVLHFSNILQCVLQRSSSNFLIVIYEACKLIDRLRNRCSNISESGSYFHKLDLFSGLTKKSAGARYEGHIPNSMYMHLLRILPSHFSEI